MKKLLSFLIQKEIEYSLFGIIRILCKDFRVFSFFSHLSTLAFIQVIGYGRYKVKTKENISPMIENRNYAKALSPKNIFGKKLSPNYENPHYREVMDRKKQVDNIIGQRQQGCIIERQNTPFVKRLRRDERS